ncbi:ATP-grasp domain-containing protein [Streptosporangium sp. NPDC048047]|uniref:ATP-grasp domain-containing protein n=1 Tax=Streptosporangium sp. NPDC048047 TaxID=3155748 RepID=UPI00342188F0
MTQDRTLLFIGATTRALRTAKEFGLGVVLLQHPNKFEAEQAALADVTFVADYTDWSAVRPLAQVAREHWGVTAALALTDPALDALGRVNDLFGLGGTGYEVCRRFRDKYEMRRRLAAHGAPTIGAEPLESREDLTSFGDRYGYPFIVKPTDAAAGIGVFRVDGPDGPDGVDAAWRRVLGLRETGVDRGCGYLFPLTGFIMEEYVDGPEFSVEAFSFSGRHVVVAVTEKLTSDAHFAELGHTVPARITSAEEDLVAAAATGFLDAMGLTDGPSHTEIRIGPRGPIVIESHNRIGGDRITDLVEAVYGIDLIAYAVGHPFGLVEEPAGRPTPRGGAAVRFLDAGPGRVTAVDGLAELRSRPDVIAADVFVKVGDVVGPVLDNNDRLGLVAATGPDGDAAVKLCEELLENTLNVQVVNP